MRKIIPPVDVREVDTEVGAVTPGRQSIIFIFSKKFPFIPEIYLSLKKS